MTAPSRTSIPEVIDRFKEYHACNSAWGSLHVVMDDGNYSDSTVQFCYDYAIQSGDPEGAELAKILLTMSKTQRAKISRLA